MQKVILKLVSVKYSGDSIGNDVRLEIEVAGELFTRDQKIKVGATFEFDQEFKRLQTDTDIFDVPVRIKIIEKDILFNDAGEIKDTLGIDVSKFPQTFNFEIKVQERNKVVSKSTAIFFVTLVADFPHSNLRQYKSPKSGQNYNQYDWMIEQAVNHWNKEFLIQDNPPPVLLDPNLVKAMIYVESKMGYYVPSNSYIKKYPNYYHSYPDVMQVADPNNDAIYAFKNSYNPNPGRKKQATEYEIIGGKEVLFFHPEANAEDAEQSIYWGVRWLYKRAQENKKQIDGTWKRKWLDWKEAAYKYNIGDPEYIDKVYKAYEKGVGSNKFQLWEMGVLALLLLIGGSFVVDQDKLDDIFVRPPAWSAAAIDSLYERADRVDISDSVITLKRSLHNFADCKMSIGSSNLFDVLEYCTYTVGSDSSDLWSVKMVDGHYYWHPENKNKEVRYEYDIDGPSSVLFEDGDIGDLNNDGKDDVVAVLRVKSGEGARVPNIVVLIQGENREMEQYANYVMQEGEEVKLIYISNGIITADVLVKSKDSPASSVSVYSTYRFKIIL